MKKQTTVEDLRKQLEALEKLGMGNAAVWFRDANDMDWEVERGIFDIFGENVVLG